MSRKQPNQQTFKPFRTLEEKTLRLALVDKIDELFVAFREAGGTNEQYLEVQYWEKFLFLAWANSDLTVDESVGALKVMNRVEDDMIRSYRKIALEKKREGAHDENR